MGLRLLGLWTVVLSLFAVVNAATKQDCSSPDLQNGFFISEKETFAHDTELYYGCDDGFQPVESTWWATVTCQNGNWSSLPLCIEDTACFDPKIPNANYTAFQYVKTNEKIWIRCNTGYEDKKKLARAVCQNGQWTTLPVCEKMDSWCGPPPQVPNAVIINQAYKETFPEDEYVEYMCKSGFELDTNDNKAYCSFGQWITPPSCRQKQTDGGPVPLATTASPVSSGSDADIRPVFTTVDKCGTPPLVLNAVPYYSKNNMYVSYVCNYLYKLNGNRDVRCFNGHWTTQPTCEDNFCKLDASRYYHVESKEVFYIPSGTSVKLKCLDDSWRTSIALCRDNQLYLSECCLKITHNTNYCGYFPQ